MTPQRRRTGLWFVAAAGVLLAVLSWLTVALLHLDGDERLARQQSDVQERLRLALWRMDSWLSPQLALESMRPATDYAPYPSAATAWTKGFAKIGPDEVVVQSPLLGSESPIFRLHFEIEQGGMICSPQVPVGNLRDFAEANGVAPEAIERAAARLGGLQSALQRDVLERAVGGVEAALPTLGSNPVAPEDPAPLQQSVVEFNNRQAAARLNFNALDNNLAQGAVFRSPTDEKVGPLVPVWIDGEPALLVYARRVQKDSTSRMQGVLVDWPTLEHELLGLVDGLFDDGCLSLCRCDQPTMEQQPSMLASVPARLVVAPSAFATESKLPIAAILWTTWGVTLLGLGALGFTLRAAIGFGERRARFASAVTHELRTPLTTFRMYSEMLADGVVKDPAAQQEYLGTLQRESDRLARVVENVLAWSRLEEGRFASRRERVPVAALVERSAQVLDQRLGEVGMKLEVELCEAAREMVVVTDEDAVGQVLFNLVDNAAKYARSATDPVVTLRVECAPGRVQIAVCDRGPGVPPEHHERVFVPFDRGPVPGSSNEVPGVGLGLPLARGLARDLGGDLRLASQQRGGACFVLELPVA